MLTAKQTNVAEKDSEVHLKRPPRTWLDRVVARPESGVVLAALIVYAFFAIMAPHFLTERVTSNILLSSASLGIIAVGVATLMIAGQFDLSVGSVYGFGAAVVVFAINFGIPGWAALPLVMAFGIAVGMVNGWLVTRLGVHSLIITLGGLMFYRGVLLAVTEGFPMRLAKPDPTLSALDFEFGPIPGPFFVFLFLVVVFTYVLTTTRFGNWIYATGGLRRPPAEWECRQEESRSRRSRLLRCSNASQGRAGDPRYRNPARCSSCRRRGRPGDFGEMVDGAVLRHLRPPPRIGERCPMARVGTWDRIQDPLDE